MANPHADPTKARQTRRSKKLGTPGSLDDARALLWRALSRAAELLEEEDPSLSLKAVHAVSQCSMSYTKMLEVGELEARLAALEAATPEHPDSGPRLGRGAA